MKKAYVDPNVYGQYTPAMKPVEGKIRAIEWQERSRAKIDEISSAKSLSDILDDERALKALIEGIKPGYATDASVAVKIGAVSQFVMSDKEGAKRKKWCDALLSRAAAAKDDYVAEFCVDQLRWCGMPEQLGALRRLSAQSDSKALRDMVSIAIDQISGSALN